MQLEWGFKGSDRYDDQAASGRLTECCRNAHNNTSALGEFFGQVDLVTWRVLH